MDSPSNAEARFAREQLMAGCATMERLLRGLVESKGRVAEKVHAIRKLGKSLRGGFLVFQLGKTSSREIQAIGRLLSGSRDAVSRLGTWQKLAWVGDDSAAVAIVGLLEQQTRTAARRPPTETIDWCIERLTAARKNLNALAPEDLADRLLPGFEKLRKQVTKRCHHLDHREEEDFHDARKALKAYLGALGFLPEGRIQLDPNVSELAELLGDENDLATLSSWLEAHGFTANFVPSLWEKLAETRCALRKQAIRKGVKLLLPPC